MGPHPARPRPTTRPGRRVRFRGIGIVGRFRGIASAVVGVVVGVGGGVGQVDRVDVEHDQVAVEAGPVGRAGRHRGRQGVTDRDRLAGPARQPFRPHLPVGRVAGLVDGQLDGLVGLVPPSSTRRSMCSSATTAGSRTRSSTVDSSIGTRRTSRRVTRPSGVSSAHRCRWSADHADLVRMLASTDAGAESARSTSCCSTSPSGNPETADSGSRELANSTNPTHDASITFTIELPSTDSI